MSPGRYEQLTERLPAGVRERLPARSPKSLPPDGRRWPAARWWDLFPLRTKLVVLLAGLLLLALLVTGVATTTLLRGVLVDDVDSRLTSQSTSQAVVDELNILFETNGAQQPSIPTDYVVLVGNQAGEPLFRLASREADLPDLTDVDYETARERVQQPFDATGEDGTPWRVISIPTTVRGTTAVTSIAFPLTQVDEAVQEARSLFWLTAFVVLLAAAVTGRVAVRRSLRPLREVEAVADAYGRGETSRRVPDAWPGTEVGRLGETLNTLLDRIETSLAAREASEARMRRFVADASHELRTPLAAIRGFAELHRQGAVREPEDVTAAFARVEAESARLGGLVEDLLALTRLDEQRPLRRDPVDLLVIAADAVHDLTALAPTRTVRLAGLDGARGPSPAPVVGDDARLRQVLTNLVGNAVRHTPDGTPLEIGVGVREHDGGRWATWQVVDHGAGIPAEDAERVFERFYRADTSRARGSGGGSGLGLAIVAALVRAHGGAARVVPTPGGGTTVEVAVPAADPEPELLDVGPVDEVVDGEVVDPDGGRGDDAAGGGPDVAGPTPERS